MHKKTKHLWFSNTNKTFPVCTSAATAKAPAPAAAWEDQVCCFVFEEGLGSCYLEDCATGKQMPSSSGTARWVGLSLPPFCLISAPCPPHSTSQVRNKSVRALHIIVGPQNQLCLQRRLEWLSLYRHKTQMYINVHKLHKQRPKPNGFDGSLQLPRHLHSL